MIIPTTPMAMAKKLHNACIKSKVCARRVVFGARAIVVVFTIVVVVVVVVVLMYCVLFNRSDNPSSKFRKEETKNAQ